jgi:hypothetical protein
MQGKQIVSLVSYAKFIAGLSQQQRTYATLIGHGDLIKRPNMRIRRILCQTIANTYSEHEDAFIIGGITMKITLQEVEHITGLPLIGKQHVPSLYKDHIEL